MLKVLSGQQIREVDQSTINDEPISSIDLMERAAQKCFDWILKNISTEKSIAVIAGMGNNGGDALAIAQQLIKAGYSIDVFVVKFSNDYSVDCEENLNRLSELNVHVNELDSLANLEFSQGVILDGIFGSGLSRKPDGLVAEVIMAINETEAKVISIDVPSGIFTDHTLSKDQVFVKADFTLTFQSPKLSSLIPVSGDAYGKVHLLDIGLSQEAINNQPSRNYYIDSIRSFNNLLKRKKFQHKGSFGHVLMVAGSKGKMGAAIISSKAVLRSGTGLCTGLVPSIGLDPYQSSVPEAMAITRDDDNLMRRIESMNISSVAIGPGLGVDGDALLLFEWILQHIDIPMVVDADGLNLIAANHKLLSLLPKGSILTPHIKEFERLFGKNENEFDRIELLRKKAVELEQFIVLKGPHTAIASPKGELYFNSTGNSGMATAGSGDCLTGVIVGLHAQCQDALASAICGVFIHGAAGDIAANKLGQAALIASDINDNIGEAIESSFRFDS